MPNGSHRGRNLDSVGVRPGPSESTQGWRWATRAWHAYCPIAPCHKRPSNFLLLNTGVPMRGLLLAEGDARTFDSWSGISQQVVANLEDAGHRVIDINCDLAGVRRYLV